MTSCARRNTSTVAPQALSLLNSPLAVESAKALATCVLQEFGNTPVAVVQGSFVLALQRPPSPEKQEACEHLLKRVSLAELCRVPLNSNEFVYLD